MDTYFSNIKETSVDIITDGGWHFTNIKTPEQIDYKMKNFLHHLEYEKSGINTEEIKKNILEKKVIYDHFSDKRKSKVLSTGKLEKLDLSELPDYIFKNSDKYQEWID